MSGKCISGEVVHTADQEVGEEVTVLVEVEVHPGADQDQEVKFFKEICLMSVDYIRLCEEI